MKKIAALAVLSLAPAIPAIAQEALVTEFGIAFKPSDAVLTKTRTRVEIAGTLPDADPRYYRLRIKVTNPEDKDWAIVIRSPVGQVLSAFDGKQTNCETDAGCWTRRLSSKLPVVQFSTQSDTVRAEVVDGVYMPAQALKTFYSPMQGSRDEQLTGLSFTSRDEKIAQQMQADNLGMFIGSGPKPDGALANWCCSGVRLTSDLFMTNWHCGAAPRMQDDAYWQKGICEAGIIDMSWDSDDEGREFSCGGVAFADRDLDVAILRLSTLADGPALSRPLSSPLLSEDVVTAGEQIAVLHHPACAPKSVTRGCSVLKAGIATWTSPRDATSATEFTHNCTTENGSSGGPVFSGDGQLVGLHHLGVSPARLEPGNFAVGVNSIMAKIKIADESLYRELSGRQGEP